MQPMKNDPQWGKATREALTAAEASEQALADDLRAEKGDEEAIIVERIGGLLLHGLAAVCSAISDVAMAIRERPS